MNLVTKEADIEIQKLKVKTLLIMVVKVVQIYIYFAALFGAFQFYTNSQNIFALMGIVIGVGSLVALGKRAKSLTSLVLVEIIFFLTYIFCIYWAVSYSNWAGWKIVLLISMVVYNLVSLVMNNIKKTKIYKTME